MVGFNSTNKRFSASSYCLALCLVFFCSCVFATIMVNDRRTHKHWFRFHMAIYRRKQTWISFIFYTAYYLLWLLAVRLLFRKGENGMQKGHRRLGVQTNKWSANKTEDTSTFFLCLLSNWSWLSIGESSTWMHDDMWWWLWLQVSCAYNCVTSTHQARVEHMSSYRSSGFNNRSAHVHAVIL